MIQLRYKTLRNRSSSVTVSKYSIAGNRLIYYMPNGMKVVEHVHKNSLQVNGSKIFQQGEFKTVEELRAEELRGVIVEGNKADFIIIDEVGNGTK